MNYSVFIYLRLPFLLTLYHNITSVSYSHIMSVWVSVYLSASLSLSLSLPLLSPTISVYFCMCFIFISAPIYTSISLSAYLSLSLSLLHKQRRRISHFCVILKRCAMHFITDLIFPNPTFSSLQNNKML